MRQVMIRYKITPEQAAENERLVRAVYDELASAQPAGFEYATFCLDDGVSFMHIAFTEEGQAPLADVRAFQEFQAGISERCAEPPVVTELREIGSYRFHA